MRDVRIDRAQLEAACRECWSAWQGRRVGIYCDLDDGSLWARPADDSCWITYRGDVIRVAEIAQPISRESLAEITHEAVTAELATRETPTGTAVHT